ncbi:hypothetical protein HK099_003908 [Clydaea vesicula]|uniref:Fe2OG dioxygenase domain-containing protein n=1 Tax=Clydaea vesicula TaxID=447962 RepID=A0AAD5XYJ7_9FUNG|nr:hypothetical protein HK099_003908 [Clydaea vesicula]KAJ3380940.1 hypothetical protein HDU92_005677 [Lobulomyces angularis]
MFNNDENTQNLNVIVELFGSDSEDELERHQKAKNQNIYLSNIQKNISGLNIYKNFLDTKSLNNINFHINNQNWFDPVNNINQKVYFGDIPQFLYENLIDELILRNVFKNNLHISDRFPLFDHLISNFYAPGEGLTHHIDLPHKFQDGIVICSIKGTCEMEFRLKNEQEYLQVIGVFLEPGDVVCLTGEARWKWEHGIRNKTYDKDFGGNMIKRTERISINLRKLKDEGLIGPPTTEEDS